MTLSTEEFASLAAAMRVCQRLKDAAGDGVIREAAECCWEDLQQICETCAVA